MRAGRDGVKWTGTRVRRRTDYATHMRSDAWATIRRAWFEEQRRRTGADAVCHVCGSGRPLDLHHLSYERMGAELYEDLVPLCRRHHEHLHTVLDASPTWRRLGLKAGSLGILARMVTAHQPERRPTP